MRKKNLYVSKNRGLRLFSLPVMNSEKENARRKMIDQSGYESAAQALDISGIGSDAPLLFCGRHGKAFPLLEQLTRGASRPFVIIGTERLSESCLASLNPSWSMDELPEFLPSGSGMILLQTDTNFELALRRYIRNWRTHYLIFCLGDGLFLDRALINSLVTNRSCCVITESISRSLMDHDISTEEFLKKFDYFIFSSLCNNAQEIVQFLPKYEEKKISNTTDYSFHQDVARSFLGHHHQGSGFRLSQTVTEESKPILTQSDLADLQEDNNLLLFNAITARVRITKIR